MTIVIPKEIRHDLIMKRIQDHYNEFCSKHIDYEEVWIRELLEDISYNIMRISIEKELEV
jgi:hypothetical protein